jgi:hypothetical protein
MSAYRVCKVSVSQYMDVRNVKFDNNDNAEHCSKNQSDDGHSYDPILLATSGSEGNIKNRLEKRITKSNLFILCLSLFVSNLSIACPLCATKAGESVRAAIFDTHFLFNCFCVFLPFFFLILIACLIYYLDHPLRGA